MYEIEPADIILASSSPIRKKLLERSGYFFHVIPSEIDEVLPEDGEPAEVAIALAQAKAWDVFERYPRNVIIGADQVMTHRGCMVSKPATREEARQRLREMSGESHDFYPAAVVVSPWFEEVVTQHATVHFWDLESRIVDGYTDIGEWRGCVGGYQIENVGAQLVKRVDGDLNAVMGLPLFPLLEVLRRVVYEPPQLIC